MILSVSRRTDIPAFYSEWFMNRIRAGSVCVINPFNAKQISRIDIKPEVVDCIVFWTKNARPLMPRLPELDEMQYDYYFQFTITPYKNDIEVNLINKGKIVETFIDLADKIGKEKVILRYDPIIITDKYNINYHLKAFVALCEKLKDHTGKVIISFLDDYRKVARNMKGIAVKELGDKEIITVSKNLADIASCFGLTIETCAEAIDLDPLGIKHGRCIDGELIEKIIDSRIINKDKRDANREHCGCMKCIDIGQYDSCMHGCLYCYANTKKELALINYKAHDPASPLLFGEYKEEFVKDRKDVKSFKIPQNTLF